jgi:hypothetical protein
MRGQLRRLVEVASMPRVTVQVVPFARGGHAGASGSFSVLRFEERDLPGVVYVEQLSSAVYLDQRSDTEHYPAVMGQLSGQALTPADTSIRGIAAAGWLPSEPIWTTYGAPSATASAMPAA